MRQRFLAGRGLRDEQFVRVDAELAGIRRIERVFHVDERRHAAALLRLGNEGQRQRRLARTFRAVNLDDAPARHAAHAERAVDEDVAGGDDLHVHHLAVAQTHDGPLAVILGDLLEGNVQVLAAFRGGPEEVRGFFFDCGFSHNWVFS